MEWLNVYNWLPKLHSPLCNSQVKFTCKTWRLDSQLPSGTRRPATWWSTLDGLLFRPLLYTRTLHPEIALVLSAFWIIIHTIIGMMLLHGMPCRTELVPVPTSNMWWQAPSRRIPNAALSDIVAVRGSPAPMTTNPSWFFFCTSAYSGICILRL